MARISAEAVRALRERTGVGMMECKRALEDAQGDIERASELLRERGLAKAVKRAGRETGEGTIAMALAGRAGALVELGCETDFVAKTDEFQRLAGEIAALAAGDRSLGEVEALLAATIDGEKVADRIRGAIGRIGENVVLKRVGRLEAEEPGRVAGYVHAGGKLGVIVALRSEGAAAELDRIGKDLAMHIAASDPAPLAVDREGVPAETLEHERAIFRKQAEQSGKPAKVVERIVEGRLQKFFNEVCLLEQPFVKDPDRSVADWLQETAKAVGSEIAVTAFLRMRLGETSGT